MHVEAETIQAACYVNCASMRPDDSLPLLLLGELSGQQLMWGAWRLHCKQYDCGRRQEQTPVHCRRPFFPRRSDRPSGASFPGVVWAAVPAGRRGSEVGIIIELARLVPLCVISSRHLWRDVSRCFQLVRRNFNEASCVVATFRNFNPLCRSRIV